MRGESYLTEDQLLGIGFKEVGRNVKLSSKTSIYTPERISIGSNVRIDDFCIISGDVKIGSYVHIASYTGLFGVYGIVLEDFVSLSARILVYSGNDDYSGEHMVNPTVPKEFAHVTKAPVVFRKHSAVGAGSIILPGVTVGEGCVVGAMSLVNRDLEPWKICVGVPCKPMKDRRREVLDLEKQLIDRYERGHL